MFQKVLGDFSIDRSNFFLVFGLLFNVFTWYFFLGSLLEQIINNSNIIDGAVIWITFYLSIIMFSIIGAVLSKRVSGPKFLYYWIALGAIATLLPALVNNFTVTPLLFVSALMGASFGLGMPSCLALFAEITKVENRGRVGGIIFLITTLTGPFLVVTLGGLSVMTQSVIYAIWRGTGLIVCCLKPKNLDSPKAAKTSFVSILRNRSFLLFFVAWLMFSLVDRFEVGIIEYFLTNPDRGLLDMMYLIEPVVATFFILIAGFMCDWIGRKKIILSGFVSLGVAYAIIGFLQLPGDISWYLYFVVDGAAWGIFYITFVLVLWGDLSELGSRGKYYALGSIPFFLSEIIPHFVTESFVKGIELSAAFSLASFFLFVAVMPLVFAPETLPEKKMELRRLRSFAEDAKKAKEKYERKMED
jgi:MFS family permease